MTNNEQSLCDRSPFFGIMSTVHGKVVHSHSLGIHDRGNVACTVGEEGHGRSIKMLTIGIHTTLDFLNLKSKLLLLHALA